MSMRYRNVPDKRDIYRPLIGCSTGTITRWPDCTDDHALARWCPGIHADAFEVMFYDTWYSRVEEIANHLCGLNLRVVAVHAEKDIGPDLVRREKEDRLSAFNRLAANCRFAHRLGAKMLVLHLWGLPDADAMLEQQLKVLPRLIDIAEGEGVQLCVEAIPCTVNTPLQNLKQVVNADPRVRIVLDTEFLAMHEELDAALQADWLCRDERVVNVHVKDFDGVPVDAHGKRRYLHPGEGSIQFNHVFSVLATHGYRGPITLESTVVNAAGWVDIVRLNESLSRLRQWIQSAWN